MKICHYEALTIGTQRRQEERKPPRLIWIYSCLAIQPVRIVGSVLRWAALRKYFLPNFSLFWCFVCLLFVIWCYIDVIISEHAQESNITHLWIPRLTGSTKKIALKLNNITTNYITIVTWSSNPSSPYYVEELIPNRADKEAL